MMKKSRHLPNLLEAMTALTLVIGVLTPTSLRAQDYAGIVAAQDRNDQDRKADERRKPADFLPFTGVRAGMRVLDLGAGGGYTTELLARAVGKDGIVYAQTPQPP